MSYARLLSIAASIGIGGYLHESLTNKWQNNVINTCASKAYPRRSAGNSRALNVGSTGMDILEKVKNNLPTVHARIDDPKRPVDTSGVCEQFPLPTDPDAQFTNNFNDGFSRELVNVVGAVNLMARQAFIRHERDKTFVSYEDYVVFFDLKKKTPYFVMQGITKDTVAAVEHFHCESLRLAISNVPADYHFGKEGCNAIATVDDVIPAVPRFVHGQRVCDYCANSTVWKVFHKYITHLTSFYDAVYVCSGPLFVAHEGDGDCPAMNGHERTPSHHFKVIFCKNASSNYRMECYIIKNEPFHDECPNLNKFVVSREELQSKAGMKFFPNIPSRMIKNKIPNPVAFVKPKSRRPKTVCPSRYSPPPSPDRCPGPSSSLASPSSRPASCTSGSCTGSF